MWNSVLPGRTPTGRHEGGWRWGRGGYIHKSHCHLTRSQSLETSYEKKTERGKKSLRRSLFANIIPDVIIIRRNYLLLFYEVGMFIKAFHERQTETSFQKLHLMECGGGELLWQVWKCPGKNGGTRYRRAANCESNTGIGSWRTGGQFLIAWHQKNRASSGTWRKSCRSPIGSPKEVWFWMRDWWWRRRMSPRAVSPGHRWRILKKTAAHFNHVCSSTDTCIILWPNTVFRCTHPCEQPWPAVGQTQPAGLCQFGPERS